MVPSNSSAAMPDGFGQGRVRVDGEADVFGVGAHLDRQRRFGDQVAGIRRRRCRSRSIAWCPRRTATWSAPSSRPSDSARPEAAHGKLALPYSMPLALASVSVRPTQATSGIGVGDRGDHLGVECGLVAAATSAATLAFVHRLVRQHRLADDVADGEDVADVGAHLLVHRNEAALLDLDARRLGADAACRWAGGRPPPAAVETSAVLAPSAASKVTRRPASSRLDRDDLGFRAGSPRSVSRCASSSGATMSLSAPGMIWSISSTTVTFDAERMIDRGHFQPDDAAADDQQALRHVVQFERAGRVDDARVVVRDERQRHRLGAGGDDRLVEGDGLLRPVLRRDFEVIGRGELPVPVTTVTLRCLAMPARPPVRRLTTLSFQPRSLSISIFGGRKRCRGRHPAASLDDFRGMQQRLGRDAADIEADAAQHRPAFDQHHLGLPRSAARKAAV